MRCGVAVATWGPFADLGALSDFVSLAEELKFESVWFADHVAIPAYATDRFDPPMLEPLALAGWVLARHDTLRVGTDVLVAPYRNPLLVAAMAGSLQQLSNGRMLLGVGIGYLRGEFAALGLDPSLRASMTDDALGALRTAWSGRGPHSFTGAAFGFDDVLPVAVPDEPVPLLVGGNNAHARARAARLGDGWHPLYPAPDAYAAGREEIEDLRSGDGSAGPFLFSYSAAACVITERPLEGRGAGALPEESRPEYRYAPAMPRDPNGRPLLCGSPEQVAADVEEYRRSGVEHMVLRVWGSASRFGPEGAMDQLRKWSEILA
jgi:alkanesulfonate monooxygenase SsuD/methylene tetrahydromethanopterin reductase-like flavin-dependent oxidoreductase (luciferase family)